MCGLLIIIISVRSLPIIKTLFRKAASQSLVQLLRMTKSAVYSSLLLIRATPGSTQAALATISRSTTRP